MGRQPKDLCAAFWARGAIYRGSISRYPSRNVLWGIDNKGGQVCMSRYDGQASYRVQVFPNGRNPQLGSSHWLISDDGQTVRRLGAGAGSENRPLDAETDLSLRSVQPLPPPRTLWGLGYGGGGPLNTIVTTYMHPDHPVLCCAIFERRRWADGHILWDRGGLKYLRPTLFWNHSPARLDGAVEALGWSATLVYRNRKPAVIWIADQRLTGNARPQLFYVAGQSVRPTEQELAQASPLRQWLRG